MTAIILSCLISLIIAIVVGHFYGRQLDPGFLECFFVFFIVVPLVTVLLSTPLYNLALHINGLDTSYYFLPPLPVILLIWLPAVLGGFLGLKSGMIWNEGDSSGFYCLIALASVLALLWLVVILLL